MYKEFEFTLEILFGKIFQSPTLPQWNSETHLATKQRESRNE